MQVICTECGHPFDDDQCCWVCAARDEAIETTFSIACPAAIIGFAFGNIIAASLFPPLISDPTWIYVVPLVSLAVAFVLAFCMLDRITRYAKGAIFFMIFVAATCLLPPSYTFLNGLLDGSPAVEVPSKIITKGISAGKGGGPYLLLSLPWNHERVNVSIRVTNWTLSDAQPGDSVRLAVHPGAFSMPWYGDVLFK